MRLRSKFLGVAVVPLVSIAFLAPSASAAVDKGTPFGPFSAAAGKACTFPIVFSGHDATVLTPKPNGAIHSEGYFDITLTNPANGKSVFRAAPGPGDFSPNGKVLYARGDWVNFDLSDPAHARVVFVSGTKFRILSRNGQVFKKSDDVKVVDLCKLIA
jgi:hypothetical protein